MATEYDLNIATGLEPLQVTQIIANELGYKWGGQDHVTTPTLFISATLKEKVSAEYFNKLFGFCPDVLVGFRLQPKSQDGERSGRQEMLRATMAMLHNESGDGVLLLNGEHVLLQKIAGQLTLNSEWREWESYSLLPEVTLPYEIRPLPSPLLA